MMSALSGQTTIDVDPSMIVGMTMIMVFPEPVARIAKTSFAFAKACWIAFHCSGDVHVVSGFPVYLRSRFNA